MDPLHAGVEQSVIALWLGHESIETTQIYLDADLALKEKILAKTIPFDSKPGKIPPRRPVADVPQPAIGDRTMPTLGAPKSHVCRPSSRLSHPQIRIVRKAAYDLVLEPYKG